MYGIHNSFSDDLDIASSPIKVSLIQKFPPVPPTRDLCTHQAPVSAIPLFYTDCSWFPLRTTPLWPCSIQGRKVIWFQCPWVTGKTEGDEGNLQYDSDEEDFQNEAGYLPTSALIKDFLLNLAHRIEAGVYVCISITTHSRCIKKYQVDRITTGVTLFIRIGNW